MQNLAISLTHFKTYFNLRQTLRDVNIILHWQNLPPPLSSFSVMFSQNLDQYLIENGCYEFLDERVPITLERLPVSTRTKLPLFQHAFYCS